MRQGKSFWIKTHGGIGNPLQKAINKAVELAISKNKRAMIFVDQKTNIDNIINTDKVVSNFFKALKEHSVVNLEDVAFSVCTKRTVPNDFSGVAIIAYGSPDLMKAVQECSGDIDVILVPWLLEEGETWAHAYNAEVLE